MSDNLVKTLREKTEDTDLNTILKTTLGGYSRKSVRDYIAMMRQQQYDMQQSFAEELKQARTEQDRLAQELAETSERAMAAKTALENAKPLVDKAAALEKDMDEAVERIRTDGVRLEKLGCELESLRRERDELRAQLERLTEEKELLQAETAAAEPAPQAVEAAGGESAAPWQQVDGIAPNLTERSENLQVQLAILNRERENTAKWMEGVMRREKSLFHALDECRTELENRREQNLCLEAENQELSRRLSDQMWQNISLNREITHMRTINENMKHRLDAALEDGMQRRGTNESQDARDVFLWNFEE